MLSRGWSQVPSLPSRSSCPGAPQLHSPSPTQDYLVECPSSKPCLCRRVDKPCVLLSGLGCIGCLFPSGHALHLFWLRGLKDLVRGVLNFCGPSSIFTGVYRKVPVLSVTAYCTFAKLPGLCPQHPDQQTNHYQHPSSPSSPLSCLVTHPPG